MKVYNLTTPVYNWHDGHYSIGIFKTINGAIRAAAKHSNSSKVYLKYFEDVLCLSLDNEDYEDHEFADYKIFTLNVEG